MATQTQPQDWREKSYTSDELKSISLVAGGFILLLIGVAIGALLFAGDHPLIHDITGYWTNLGTEVLSVIATVLVINRLAERREIKRLKDRLVHEAASQSNERAKAAIDDLRHYDWLDKLGVADLAGANLQGANLAEANLHSPLLLGANLQGANLMMADLRGANLMFANLQGADLRTAKLQGANLAEANLQGVILGHTKFDETTLLPNTLVILDLVENNEWNIHGSYYDVSKGPEQMARFTHPNHPDFWRSNHPNSPAYKGDDTKS